MGKGGIGGHHSHRMEKDEWLTPPEIIEALGPFDCDPCAPIVGPWPTATTHYTIEDDGLSKDWHGLVWLNPPYGYEAVHWLRKLANHGDGIALIFARTETEAFRTQVWGRASALLFLYGRLHFYHATGERAGNNSGAPSVLVGYGDLAVDRLEQSGLDGAFVPGWRS